MGTLTRPDLPPGDLRTLSDALHEAHHRAGRPSLRDLAREVGCSRTTVSAMFSEPRPPRWGLLELVVEALGADLAPFHRMWLQATQDPTGPAHSNPATASSPDTGPPSGPWVPGPAAPDDSVQTSALGPAALPPTAQLRQMPAAVAGFIGRTDLLAGLDALLLAAPGNSVPIGLLTGTAGVGKTALARQWAHRCANRYPGGTLYVDLHGYHPGPAVSAHEVLAEFVRALRPGTTPVPEGTRERAALFRSLAAGRRILVLLDNAGTFGQVEDLLPGDPGCAALVTSRDALSGLVVRYGATRFGVGLMSGPEARALMSSVAGARVTTEPGPVDVLVRRCARLPLALRVAAELITSRPEESIADLVEELQAPDLLDVLDPGDGWSGVRTVFSWSYEHLTELPARLFRRIGLHPGPDYHLAGFAALADCDRRAARAAADELTRSHLLERLPGDRFRMHDLLRAYAAELVAADPADENEAARTRLFDSACADARAAAASAFPSGVSTGVNPKNIGLQWLTTQRAALLAIGQVSGPHAGQLSEILAPFLDAGAHYDDAETLHRRALATADNDQARARALNRLGTIHRRRGAFDQALHEYQRSAELFRAAGDDAGLGQALQNSGIIRWRRGDYPGGRAALEQALALHRAVGARSGEGTTLYSLGIVHRRLGDYRLAAQCHRAAVTLLEEIGDLVGLGKALNNLAVLQVYRGEPERALVSLERTLAIQRRLGDRAGENAVLSNLGLAQERLGRLAEAEASLRLALRIADEIAYPVGRIDALRGLGVVLARSAHQDQAVAYLREALALAEQLGEGGSRTAATRELGEVLLSVGPSKEASATLTAALRMAVDTGDRYEQAMTLLALARLPGAAPENRQMAARLLGDLGLRSDAGPAPET
ncbi:ATP-binding protein [Kineosporia rhizophila]|uniref:ATP-binding protein n=1 Tax=Kineosporia rhizophila TaxID=84633 RepID=UPI0022B7F2EB|nr:tetratricopeptide repeat protein [Kineosporia rhizophila]